MDLRRRSGRIGAYSAAYTLRKQNWLALISQNRHRSDQTPTDAKHKIYDDW